MLQLIVASAANAGVGIIDDLKHFVGFPVMLTAGNEGINLGDAVVLDEVQMRNEHVAYVGRV